MSWPPTMHDASAAGLAIRHRALAYWAQIDDALRMTQATQKRGRAYLLVRALCRLTVTLVAAATMLTSVYISALILLLSFS